MGQELFQRQLGSGLLALALLGIDVVRHVELVGVNEFLDQLSYQVGNLRTHVRLVYQDLKDLFLLYKRSYSEAIDGKEVVLRWWPGEDRPQETHPRLSV